LKWASVDRFLLYRIRWQVELVFKLWKSEGGVASSQGKTGMRCLCEFLAKLLGQIIANWLMLLRGGRLGEVSPTRLYRQVSRSTPEFVEALVSGDAEALWVAIDKLLNRWQRIKPKQKRKGSTFFPGWCIRASRQEPEETNFPSAGRSSP
jgi:hypothetical protein